MENNLDIIQSIKDAVLRLKQENKALLEQKKENEDQVLALQKEIADNKQKVQTLQEKWDNHQSANAEAHKSDNTVTLSEEEMHAMVNEIDKCIALLKDKNE